MPTLSSLPHGLNIGRFIVCTYVTFLQKSLSCDTFLLQVFPKVKKDEALVYHGTEFPVGEEHQTTNVMSLHQHFVIADYLHVTVEIAHGQNFTIVSPRTVR